MATVVPPPKFAAHAVTPEALARAAVEALDKRTLDVYTMIKRGMVEAAKDGLNAIILMPKMDPPEGPWVFTEDFFGLRVGFFVCDDRGMGWDREYRPAREFNAALIAVKAKLSAEGFAAEDFHFTDEFCGRHERMTKFLTLRTIVVRWKA